MVVTIIIRVVKTHFWNTDMSQYENIMQNHM